MLSRSFYLAMLIAVSPVFANAQTAPAKPCSAPECHQFDFWVGDWELTYGDTMHAANHITKDMDGCVIHEHFDGRANGGLEGESWSVYNPIREIWQQTWVDNQGGYIALAGTLKEGRLTLLTEPQHMPGGITKQNRMVYYNITPTAFDWDWEATTDNGKTWKSNWRIHYKRKG